MQDYVFAITFLPTSTRALKLRSPFMASCVIATRSRRGGLGDPK